MLTPRMSYADIVISLWRHILPSCRATFNTMPYALLHCYAGFSTHVNSLIFIMFCRVERHGERNIYFWRSAGELCFFSPEIISPLPVSPLQGFEAFSFRHLFYFAIAIFDVVVSACFDTTFIFYGLITPRLSVSFRLFVIIDYDACFIYVILRCLHSSYFYISDMVLISYRCRLV